MGRSLEEGEQCSSWDFFGELLLPRVGGFMNKISLSLTAAAVATVLLWSSGEAAEHMGDANRPAPTKEQREQMAKLHEHMAACLRSDKSMRECHEAARKECQDTMGDRCGMMMNSMMEHRMNNQRENEGVESHPHQ